MKKLLFISIITLAGCSTPDIGNISAITDTATKLALEFGVNNPDQRVDIANYLYSGALALRSLMGGTPLTESDFQNNISKWFPETETYQDIALSISKLYSAFFPEIGGDTKKYMSILESIAEGLESAAKSIIDDSK